MPSDDLTMFHDALKATLAASGVLGKVRAQLKMAALEAVNRDGSSGSDPLTTATAVNAHQIANDDSAEVLAHALVLDFLQTRSTLSQSASVFASEAGVERLPQDLQRRPGLEAAAGVEGSNVDEPLLVSLLRRPGGLHGASSSRAASSAPISAEPSPSKSVGQDSAPSPMAPQAAASGDERTYTGPSFSAASAARWPNPPGQARDGDFTVTDEAADDAAVRDVKPGMDWDHVETAGGGASDVGSSSAAPPSAAPSQPQPATIPATASAGFSSATAAADPMPQSMQPPDEESDDAYDFDDYDDDDDEF